MHERQNKWGNGINENTYAICTSGKRMGNILNERPDAIVFERQNEWNSEINGNAYAIFEWQNEWKVKQIKTRMQFCSSDKTNGIVK